LPLVVTDDVENIRRSSEARELFENLGLKLDLNRIKRGQKIRAGKGKMRGRRRRHGVGPLFVIDEDKGIRKAVRNFSGVNVLTVDKMDARSLAPGTVPGRLTIWVSSAFKKLDFIYMKGG
jgi:large subunit ribosomal protein L4e